MIVRPSREGVAKVNPPDRDLRDRIEELEEENRQLREQLAPVLPRNPKIKLMRSHRRVLDLLMAKSPNVAAKETILVVCFGEDHHDNNVTVAIWYIRNALRPHGVQVSLEYGVGYYIDAGNANKLRDLLQ